MQVVDSELDDPANVQRYTALAPFDVDADGLPDVVSAGELRGDADYRYARPTAAGVPNLEAPISRPVAGGGNIQPLDGLVTAVVGGEPWLVQTDPGSTVIDLFGRDDGTINFHDQKSLAANIQSVAIGDANANGLPDIVVLLSNGTVSLIPVIPQGGFSFDLDVANTVPLGSVAGTPLVVRYADVAGSTLPDVVVLTSGAGEEKVRVATATGSAPITFSGFVSGTTPANPRDLELADFDGDGRRDVLLGTNAGVSIARNETGTGGPVVGVTSSRAFNVVPDVAAADVDGDGTPEVAAGLGSTVAIALLEVTGTTPAVPQTSDTVNGVETVLAVDLEGDGADEVVVAGRSIDVLTNVSPGAVVALPNPSALGTVEVGRTGSPVQIALTNQREGTERVRSVRVEGAAASEILAVDACTAVLAPGEQCTLTARLSPSDVGTRSAQLRVDLAHAADLVIPVSGEGSAPSPGPAGPTGPQGPQGPEGPPGSSDAPQLAAVLTTAKCSRKQKKVGCTLRLAERTDIEGQVRLIAGRKTVGRATLEEGATNVKVAGKVPPSRKSVVIELALPGLDVQRVNVPVKR